MQAPSAEANDSSPGYAALHQTAAVVSLWCGRSHSTRSRRVRRHDVSGVARSYRTRPRRQHGVDERSVRDGERRGFGSRVLVAHGCATSRARGPAARRRPAEGRRGEVGDSYEQHADASPIESCRKSARDLSTNGAARALAVGVQQGAAARLKAAFSGHGRITLTFELSALRWTPTARSARRRAIVEASPKRSSALTRSATASACCSIKSPDPTGVPSAGRRPRCGHVPASCAPCARREAGSKPRRSRPYASVIDAVAGRLGRSGMSAHSGDIVVQTRFLAFR